MGILSGLGRWLGPRPAPEAAVREAIGRALDAVDPRLKAVPDYERRLAPAVSHALRHCEALADEMPGPVEIGVRAFGADPLVHAMFATAGDIADMLGRSRAVREFLADPDNIAREEFFALLGMRHREKTATGLALNGDVVQHGSTAALALLCRPYAGGTRRRARDHAPATSGGGLRQPRARLCPLRCGTASEEPGCTHRVANGARQRRTGGAAPDA